MFFWIRTDCISLPYKYKGSLVQISGLKQNYFCMVKRINFRFKKTGYIMKIGGSTESIVKFYYNSKDILQEDSKISTDKDMALKQNDGSMSQALSNFKEIAKRFPDISFIVTDDYNGVKEEYKGISSVSCFGYQDKISIALNEEVIKNWHEDSESITTMINTYSCFLLSKKYPLRF